MIILLLNTSSRVNEILIASEKEVLASLSWKSERNEADVLLSQIENCLQQVKKTFQDVTHILTVAGPGGFTSIRVGVTTANALAYSLHAFSASISLFDWWQHRLRDLSDYMLVSSATGDSVFLQSFGKYQKYFPKFALVTISEIPQLVPNFQKVPLYGELIERHLPQFLNFQEVSLAKKSIDCSQFFPHIAWEKGKIIEPLYGRKAVASEKISEKI